MVLRFPAGVRFGAPSRMPLSFLLSSSFLLPLSVFVVRSSAHARCTPLYRAFRRLWSLWAPPLTAGLCLLLPSPARPSAPFWVFGFGGFVWSTLGLPSPARCAFWWSTQGPSPRHLHLSLLMWFGMVHPGAPAPLCLFATSALPRGLRRGLGPPGFDPLFFPTCCRCDLHLRWFALRWFA